MLATLHRLWLRFLTWWRSGIRETEVEEDWLGQPIEKDRHR